ncbi:HDOD domain-containing protein [Burkholderiaceae bacterium DAT-1]|nr:HDOD domain-containing protein [Burkholderiaceae bacterium DAT-1]
MSTAGLTQEEVIKRSEALPVFPGVVNELLATIDDPNANVKILSTHVSRDPVLTGRVLAVANAAAQSHGGKIIRDIHSAVTLIGLGKVRNLAIKSCINDFVKQSGVHHIAVSFYEHSVGVGICAQEVATTVPAHVDTDFALVSGLLHDIGQLWLFRFKEDVFKSAWSEALQHNIAIERSETTRFGIDHSVIGAWLAEYWRLPEQIIAAIRYHHEPENALPDELVATLHVAEVLSNALDVSGRKENRVTTLSSAACDTIGLDWTSEETMSLFGRIEARCRLASEFFEAHLNDGPKMRT